MPLRGWAPPTRGTEPRGRAETWGHQGPGGRREAFPPPRPPPCSPPVPRAPPGPGQHLPPELPVGAPGRVAPAASPGLSSGTRRFRCSHSPRGAAQPRIWRTLCPPSTPRTLTTFATLGTAGRACTRWPSEVPSNPKYPAIPRSSLRPTRQAWRNPVQHGGLAWLARVSQSREGERSQLRSPTWDKKM